MRRLLSTLTFRLRGRAPERLQSFARAELGSMIDLRQAASATADPARAARYLAHADDEARHAKMFDRHARRWARQAGRSLPPLRADTEALFERLGEVGFLAFVHRGERGGRQDFEGYRDHFAARGDDATVAPFESILEDERRHEAYTGALVDVLAPRPDAAHRGASLRAAWRAYRRAGRALATALYVGSMLALYVVCAPLALWVKLTHPTRAGWR